MTWWREWIYVWCRIGVEHARRTLSPQAFYSFMTEEWS